MKLTLKKTAQIFITWSLTLVSAVFLCRKSSFFTSICSNDTLLMAIELTIVFAWLFGAIYFIKQISLSYGIIALVVYLFLWAHRATLSVFAAAVYVLYLVLLGNMFTGKKSGKNIAEKFVLGTALQIIITGLISLIGIAEIRNLRIQVLILFAIAFTIYWVRDFNFTSFLIKNLPADREQEKEEKNKLWLSASIALILTMLLLQAGRINSALDYDSLHYGLRSMYVLDNSGSIFDNPGLVNDVYVYPKGLETLLLPLNLKATYGPVLCFSLIMTAGSLCCIYETVKKRSCRMQAIYATAVASVIPAIMNMGISAKTDAATLAFQMIGIMLMLDGRLSMALCAFLITYSFKSTSFLFSTLPVIYIIVLIIKNRSKIELPAIAVTFAADLLIVLRTFLITGLPTATVGRSVWTSLGFSDKYPFGGLKAFSEVNAGSVIKRMIGVFACPVGEENAHVYIAWGSLIVTFLIASIVFKTIIKKKADMLTGLTLTVFAASIFCILSLSQVDGNYFMLLYALCVVNGFTLIHERDLFVASFCLLPAIVLAATMCLVTNWSGYQGFTEIKLSHAGYYDHASDRYDQMICNNCEKIGDYLNKKNDARVLSIAQQPEGLQFDCVVQSYTDIEGSGGNVVIVKTLDNFKKFLDWSGTEYLYTEDSFLNTHSRAQEIVKYMLEDGSLKLIIEEGSNRLYAYWR